MIDEHVPSADRTTSNANEFSIHGLDNKCPICGNGMLIMYGYGWDYDRLICSTYGCDGEVELETITYGYESEGEIKDDE